MNEDGNKSLRLAPPAAAPDRFFCVGGCGRQADPDKGSFGAFMCATCAQAGKTFPERTTAKWTLASCRERHVSHAMNPGPGELTLAQLATHNDRAELLALVCRLREQGERARDALVEGNLSLGVHHVLVLLREVGDGGSR